MASTSTIPILAQQHPQWVECTHRARQHRMPKHLKTLDARAARSARQPAQNGKGSESPHAQKKTKNNSAPTHLRWLLHHGLEVAHQPQPGGSRRAAHDGAHTLAHGLNTGQVGERTRTSTGGVSNGRSTAQRREGGRPRQSAKRGQAGRPNRRTKQRRRLPVRDKLWRRRRRRTSATAQLTASDAVVGGGGRVHRKASEVAMVVVARQRAWERAGGGASAGGGTCHLHSGSSRLVKAETLCLALVFHSCFAGASAEICAFSDPNVHALELSLGSLFFTSLLWVEPQIHKSLHAKTSSPRGFWTTTTPTVEVNHFANR